MARAARVKGASIAFLPMLLAQNGEKAAAAGRPELILRLGPHFGNIRLPKPHADRPWSRPQGLSIRDRNGFDMLKFRFTGSSTRACLLRDARLGCPAIDSGKGFDVKFKGLTALALVLSLTAGPALAQDKDGDKKGDAPAEKVIPQVHVARLSGIFGGQKVAYTATIGETILAADDGTQKAAIVTTAYVREPRDPNRPVTFLFNGGPGSGSVWLQMGAFGPK